MKKVITIMALFLVLVGCNTTEEEISKEPLEIKYPEIQSANEDMYREIYGEEDLPEINPVFQEFYNTVIGYQQSDELWIGTEEIKTAHGGFSDVLETTTNYHKDTNRVDSYMINPYNGDKQIETILRGNKIYQRFEPTGIVDETSFYWDEQTPGHYYILGLNSRIDMTLARMLYFIDPEHQSTEKEAGGTSYTFKIEDLERLRAYGDLDIPDDYAQFVKSAKDKGITGAELLAYDTGSRLVLRLDLYLEEANWSLIKKIEKGEDLYFRDMTGMEPEQTDLKVQPELESEADD